MKRVLVLAAIACSLVSAPVAAQATTTQDVSRAEKGERGPTLRVSRTGISEELVARAREQQRALAPEEPSAGARMVKGLLIIALELAIIVAIVYLLVG